MELLGQHLRDSCSLLDSCPPLLEFVRFRAEAEAEGQVRAAGAAEEVEGQAS